MNRMTLTNKNLDKNQSITEKADILYDSINVLADMTRRNADKLLNDINKKTGNYINREYDFFKKT